MFNPKYACVMSAYLPTAFVSDIPEDRHCLPCLTYLADTLTVMTTIPHLCTGSCVKNILYTTKGPTHERRKKTTRDCKPLGCLY